MKDNDKEINNSIEVNTDKNLKNKNNKKFKIKKDKLKQTKKKKGIHVGIGSFMLILFCTFLMVVATFLQLNISHFYLPSKFFNGEILTLNDFIFSIKYIPQVPVVLFIGGLLGHKLGFFTVLLYIILGLFFVPVFALGGGFSYIFEYSFGYILAFLPAVFVLGKILKKDYSYVNIAKAVFFSVLIIHVIGIIYMCVLALIKQAGINFIISWISAQSGIKILYDFVLGYLLVLCTKYARIILWFYL